MASIAGEAKKAQPRPDVGVYRKVRIGRGIELLLVLILLYRICLLASEIWTYGGLRWAK